MLHSEGQNLLITFMALAADIFAARQIEAVTCLVIYGCIFLLGKRKDRNYGSFESAQVTLIGSGSKILVLLVYDCRGLSDNRVNCQGLGQRL